MLASRTVIEGACLVHVGTGVAARSSGATNDSWAITASAVADASHHRRAPAATTQAGRYTIVEPQRVVYEHKVI